MQLWPVAVYCPASVAVGPEPEGRVGAAANGDEHFAEIMKSGAVVCSAVGLVCTRACAQTAVHHREAEQQGKEAEGRNPIHESGFAANDVEEGGGALAPRGKA